MTIFKMWRAIDRGVSVFLALVIVTFSKNASAAIIDLDDAGQKQDEDLISSYHHLLTERQTASADCREIFSLQKGIVVVDNLKLKEKLA